MNAVKMNTVKLRFATTAATLMVMSGLALAEPPAVLDRVPKDAAVVVAVRNVDALKGKVTRLFKALNLPEEAFQPIEQIEQFTGAEGFNKTGSIALVITKNADDPTEIGEDQMMVLMPVADAGKFFEAHGGDGKAKDTVLQNLGHDVNARNVGNGYIVIGPSSEALSKFDAPAGQMKSHIESLGKTGGRIADSADVLVMADVSIFAEKILAGFDEGFDQMENFAAMGGGDEEATKKMMEAVKGSAKTVIRDMKTGIIGLGLSDEGIAMDFAAQFKEGSDTSGMLQFTGRIAGLTGKLPNIPFMVAGAVDMKNPLVKKITDFGRKMGEMTGGSLSFMNAGMNMADKIDGQAFVLGTNPAIFQAGLLSNMVTYTSTANPDEYVKATRQVIEAANNKTEKGLALKTTYTEGGAEAAGKKADVWSVTMDVDPKDPNADQAAQMKQMMQMMMGQQEKLTGMIAKTDGGVIQTMSTNPELIGKAIDAAGGKGGLSGGDWFKLVSNNLPAGRSFEIYLGIKGLSDTAGAFMQMMGMPMPFELKDDLPPLGLAGSTEGGAMSVRAYVPMSTIKGVGDAVRKMEENRNNPAGGEKPNNERRKPRF